MLLCVKSWRGARQQQDIQGPGRDKPVMVALVTAGMLSVYGNDTVTPVRASWHVLPAKPCLKVYDAASGSVTVNMPLSPVSRSRVVPAGSWAYLPCIDMCDKESYIQIPVQVRTDCVVLVAQGSCLQVG